MSKYPAYLWTAYGLNPVPEWKFHPTRLWRLDFAWFNMKIAVEIEGGIWMRGKGAHSRPQNIERDMEKQNDAGLLGWRIFRFTPTQLHNGEAQAFMLKVIKGVQ